ncbi:MAG: flagellar hook-associated protein FlgK [Aquificaceae bacterium]|nr:flagellar hook-associated protein FlgK [Aquificaceae bacterium]
MFGATFGIVAQGLEMFRKSADVRNRNILNANNPNYVQEEVIITSFAPVGVKLDEIQRTQNFYYMLARNQKLSVVSSLDTAIKGNAQVESLFQEFTQGLGGSEYVDRFFKAYQNLMKEPTNEGARSELLNSAQSLVSYIKDRKVDMDRIMASTDYDMKVYLNKINTLAKKIAQTNQEILTGYAQTYARGKDYKNLLDERDKYLRELSELIDINVQEDEIGRVRVETALGFVLVEDRYNWELKYNAGNKEVLWKSKDGSEVNISDFIGGGKIRGLLDFQKDLKEYTDELEKATQKLISEIKVPLNAQATNNWYWFNNMETTSTAFGFSGSITFNISATTSVTINYTSTTTLSSLVNTINNNTTLTGNFLASIVTNADNTYTMVITATNPSYTISDSNKLVHRSEPLFTGTQIADVAISSSADSYMRNLDYEKVDEFMGFSKNWWRGLSALYNKIVDTIASKQRDLKTKHEIESALLTSLETRIHDIQGVSLDNEFIELMKIQRSYEALARTINAMDEMIQATINMV